MTSLAKLWIFLLTLVSGLLALSFLLSPAQVRRSLERTESDRLELAQEAAQLLLQNSARLWVDSAVQVAGDAILQSTLEESGRNEAEPDLVHRTAQEQLRKLNQVLKVSFLILTDSRGKVLARAGRDDAPHQDNLIGYPLVADAVRGYRLDDLWFQDGALYRMAAAPVISQARDRYVGAVILGQAVTAELAQQLHKGLGVDVVFLCGGQVVASSRDRVPQDLLPLAADHSPGLSQGGRTGALPVAGDTEVALLSGLPGEASAQGATLGLLSSGPAATSIGGMITALVESVGRGDLPYARLPALGGAMVLAFLIGLLLLRGEVEAPFARLLRDLHEPPGTEGGTGEAEAHDKGRQLPLSPERYRGSWRQLAAAVNALFAGAAERAPHAAAEAPATALLPAAALHSLPSLSAASTRSGIAEFDREARSAAVTDREARSAAVTDREARSAAVTDRDARSAAVTDRDARSAAVNDRDARSATPQPLLHVATTVQQPVHPVADQTSAASPKSTGTQPVQPAAASPPRPAAQATPKPPPAPQPPLHRAPAHADLSAFAESAATQPSLPTALTSQAIPVVMPPAPPAPDRQAGGRQPAKTESNLPIPLKLPGTRPAGAIPARPGMQTRPIGSRGQVEPVEGAPAAPSPDSSRTLHDPNLPTLLHAEEVAELADNPTMRDIPPSLVQAAIESALETSPASFRGPVPQALRARSLTGPISSVPAPGQRAAASREPSRPPAPSQASPLRQPAQSQASPARSLYEEPTAVSGTDGRLAQQRETEEELEAAFRQTYQEFVVAKQRCNEPVEGLTFEKFAVKLRQSRDQIMKQHRCKTVRFHVYIKEGKAALKATPVAR